jgi:hypothetical protein
MESANHPTTYAVIITIITMLVTSVIQWTFLLRLKKSHTEQWLHAGSPTIWSDQSILSAWPTIKYLQQKIYLSSENMSGINFCNKFRSPMLIGYWLTVIVICGCIVVAIINGVPQSWKQ